MAENENDKAPPAPPVEGGSDDVTPDEVDTSGYVGVDPIYQNYADDTLKPLGAEEGVAKVLEDRAAAHEEAVAKQVIGVTGYANTYASDDPPANREEELVADAKRKTAQAKALDKQRADALKQRQPGAQV